MSSDTVYTRTLRRAAEAVGDTERLAKALRASVAEIETWIAGHATPSPSVFLRAIDIVAKRPRWRRGVAD